MKKDQSFGIIPVRQDGERWMVFLIKHRGGHWGFPKGHADPGEHPNMTAERELTEESGLRVVNYVTGRPLTEWYRFRLKGEMISKTVTYFPAVVEGEVVLQLEEVVDSKWVPVEEAGPHLSFPEARTMCAEVAERLGVSSSKN